MAKRLTQLSKTDIVVVGDGAVGIAVAVALSASGLSVTLAGPPGTAEKRQTFTLEGYFSESAELFHTAIDAVLLKAPVIVALKAYSIRDAVPDISRIFNGNILCLSNGMDLAGQWAELSDKVKYSVLSIGFNKVETNVVLTSKGSIFCQSNSFELNLFEKSIFPVIETENVNDIRWVKWYANSIINPIGALSGRANDKIISAGLLPLITRLSLELSSFMPSQKLIIEGNKLVEWLLKNSTNRCSMLQDIENGRPTEIDFLTGLCEKRLQNNCPTASILVSLIKSKYSVKI